MLPLRDGLLRRHVRRPIERPRALRWVRPRLQRRRGMRLRRLHVQGRVDDVRRTPIWRLDYEDDQAVVFSRTPSAAP